MKTIISLLSNPKGSLTRYKCSECGNWWNPVDKELYNKLKNSMIKKQIDKEDNKCSKCNGTGVIRYYHDCGDHFSAGPAPGSGWKTKPCKCKKDK